MNRKKTLIIAEAGVNHNGNLDMALRLVDSAADAGADIVKFQTFKAANIVTADAVRAEYQQKNTGDDESQYAMLRRLELTEEDHHQLLARCRDRGIEFLSTPFDIESVDFLASIGVRRWKIPSGEITNYPLIRKIAGMAGHVILSTGMSTPEEIAAALDVLAKFGKNKEDITLLHCTTEYPAPVSEVNLRAIEEMRELFGVETGYSDHTEGIIIPVAAVALGASVIEKHFTLSRDLPGPDHKASLEPAELAAMVSGIRDVEKALGDGHKRVAPSEMKNRDIARKSIVAATAIRKGEAFTEKNLTAKRPGTGISPMMWESIVGQTAPKDFEVDEQITIEG